MRSTRKIRFVIDASVILKLFTKDRESDLEKALQIREDYRARKIDLFAPELLIYEMTNVLRYKEALQDEIVLKAISSIYSMDILIPVNLQIMKDAFYLAREHDITIYDSTYLSCAQHSGCFLITADKIFFQKLKGVPGILFISGYNV